MDEANANATPATPSRRRFGLDLRGRIILVLLVAGALSALVTSWLGFQSGRDGLTERITSQLAGRRDVVAKAIERDFGEARDHLIALTDDVTVRTALSQLPGAFERLGDERLDAEPLDRLRGYYAEVFLPQLVLEDGAEPVVDAFVPDGDSARAAQFLYVVPQEGDAPSILAGSSYARIHERIHPTFASLVNALDYRDLFLIGPDGRVLYAVAKEPDFATDLQDGPHSQTGLARAFRAARDEGGARFVHVEDYDFYRPSLGAPAAFMASPVYDGAEFLGVVAVQLSSERIDRLLGDDVGLGATADTFIVGVDGRLRSNIRRFREDPETFLAALRADRGNTEALDAIERTGTTILNLGVVSPVIEAAARGESGVRRLDSNYRGEAALAAFSPLDLPGLDWVMKVEVPVAEAFEPVQRFQRRVLITAVGLAIALTLFSMWAAGAFTEPIRALIERARRVGAGDLDTTMRLPRSDEFGELSDSMQDMTDELRARRNTADAARLRTEALLGRFLPAGIVRDVKDRDPETDEFNIAEEIENVSVVTAELSGYEGMMQDLPPLRAIAALDELVQLVDDATDRAGVEKLRTVGGTYLAVAGLSAPQLDHMQRAIAFARELRAIIARFARESGAPIGVRIGVASGPIVVGVIGRRRLSFDMYGPAVAEAEALRNAAVPGEIRLGAMTVEVLGEAIESHPAPDGAGHLLDGTAEPDTTMDPDTAIGPDANIEAPPAEAAQ